MIQQIAMSQKNIKLDGYFRPTISIHLPGHIPLIQIVAAEDTSPNQWRHRGVLKFSSKKSMVKSVFSAWDIAPCPWIEAPGIDIFSIGWTWWNDFPEWWLFFFMGWWLNQWWIRTASFIGISSICKALSIHQDNEDSTEHALTQTNPLKVLFTEWKLSNVDVILWHCDVMTPTVCVTKLTSVVVTKMMAVVQYYHWIETTYTISI